MENRFKQIMSSKSDEELITIVTIERENYQLPAIEAAEEEIKNRNISNQSIENTEKEIIERKQKHINLENNTIHVGIRFINFIIDTIGWSLIACIISFPLNYIGYNILVEYIIVFSSFIGYYVLLETKYQKTLGKLITKTKVVTYNEEKPKNSEIIARTFLRLVPFDAISFLFTRNGFHDMLSKTKVIKDNT